MTKDDRFLDHDGAKAAMLVIMQIRSADTACGHGQQHLAGAGFGHGKRFDPDVFLLQQAADARVHSQVSLPQGIRVLGSHVASAGI